MKKTLIAAALATIFTTPLMAAGHGVSGDIRLGLQNSDELDVVSGKLVIGLSGSEDIGGGMALSYGIEFENDSADEEVNQTKTNFSNDKSWVAVSGAFGKVIAGEHSDMAGWACGGTDILTYGTDEACEMGHNTSPANAIQYRGGAGDIAFGVAMTNDGNGESNLLVGIQFTGPNFAIGAQMVDADTDGADVDTSVGASDPTQNNFGGVAAGDTGSVIGGTYNLGDITLALTLGDNGDETATSIGVQAPAGAGTVKFVLTTSGDNNDDNESVDVEYRASLGNKGYYGVELNTVDSAADDVLTAFVGTKF